MKKGGARVCVATRRALRDVWLRCIAALVNLDGAHNDKLWKSRSGAVFYCLRNIVRHSVHTMGL